LRLKTKIRRDETNKLHLHKTTLLTSSKKDRKKKLTKQQSRREKKEVQEKKQENACLQHKNTIEEKGFYY